MGDENNSVNPLVETLVQNINDSDKANTAKARLTGNYFSLRVEGGEPENIIAEIEAAIADYE